MDPAKVSFTATVHPCSVSLATVTAPKSMSYTLGGPPITSPFSIIQEPACYHEAVTVESETSGLLLDVVRDLETGSEAVRLQQTFDRGLLGRHTVKLVKTVSQPDDFTQSDFTDLVQEVVFEIQILDNAGCLISEVDIYPSNDIAIQAGSATRVELVVPHTLFLACRADYTFFTVPAYQWLNIEEQVLGIMPTYDDVGTYEVTFAAYFT